MYVIISIATSFVGTRLKLKSSLISLEILQVSTTKVCSDRSTVAADGGKKIIACSVRI